MVTAMPDTTGLEYNSLFTDPTEAFICLLNRRGAEDYIDKGVLTDGFAVLSDERLYIKGTYFSCVGNNYARMRDELVLDASSVADMEIAYNNPLRLMLVAVALLIISYTSIILGVSGVQAFQTTFSISISIILIIAVILLSVGYSANRRILFEIIFHGGSALAFKYELLGDDEIRAFKSSVELIKKASNRIRDERLVADKEMHAQDATTTIN